ncbi:MAG TPA: YciI family protein [Steroidobacteraceae bacterium]|nr:YciI family protein [Steroidobacteraceae bacterium]
MLGRLCQREPTCFRGENRRSAMSASKSKFLCLFRFAAAGWPAKPTSPQEMQAQYAAWRTWMTQFEKELIPGDGLTPAGAVVRGGNVTDGPFIEAKEVVASYCLIEATSRERAIEIIKACPAGMDANASVEIRQLGGYGG